MSRITKPYRGSRPSKRLDLTDMRELFRDRRQWVAIGVVTAPPGAASHFEQTDTDILVDVVLQPALHDVTCRLGAGLWVVPAVGEEVVVTFPEGAMDFMPTIQGILSSGTVPAATGGGAQPPTPTRIAIVRQEVVVHDGAGGAKPLPTLASLQTTIDKLNDLISKYLNHTHTSGGSGSPTSSPLAPNDAEDPAPDAVGTEVFKGK